MSSIFYPKSFQQLLLAGFLLLALLLGGAMVNAIVSLESLMEQSQQATYHAVQLSQVMQRLAQRTETEERVARQYLLLGDPALLKTYAMADRLAHQTATELGALPVSPAVLQALSVWRQANRDADLQLNDNLLPMPDRQTMLSRDLATLTHANEVMRGEGQRWTEAQLEQIRQRVARYRQLIAWQVAGVLILAITLALLFGWLVSRPVQQLERAIRRLGEHELGMDIAIRGPADLAQLGVQLNWLRLRLLDLEAEKSRFLRHMSHELKTPLTAIREGAELLVDEVAGALSPAQRQIARILRQNSLHLQRQIEALLDYSKTRVAVGDLQTAPCSVDGVLERVVEAQDLHLQARHLKLERAFEPVSIVGDENKIRAVFDNLLSNAIKFSPAGGSIQVRLKRLGDCVQFDCIDQGPGVSDQERHRIFEPFYQGEHQPVSHVHGSGIGLSIARDYVEMHGGSIAVLDRDDSPGVCFRIWLPLEPGRMS